jgi:hypothetical protein
MRSACLSHLITLDWIILIIRVFGEAYSYKAPHYAIFSNHPSLYPSSVQIFSSAPYSQIYSFYVLPFLWEVTFHTHRKPKNYIHVYIFNLNVFAAHENTRFLHHPS